jgi:hypothetical protein
MTGLIVSSLYTDNRFHRILDVRLEHGIVDVPLDIHCACIDVDEAIRADQAMLSLYSATIE